MPIIDPTDENVALDTDGAVMYGVRMVPIQDKYKPTLAELQAAPVIGYARPMCLRCGTNTCEHEAGAR